MSFTFTPVSVPLRSPSSTYSSERHEKNNNAMNDENGHASQLALILLIVGICVPCIWIINWLMHRNSYDSKAR
ncbi:unnamed protein product, partial [Rotaria sordida]